MLLLTFKYGIENPGLATLHRNKEPWNVSKCLVIHDIISQKVIIIAYYPNFGSIRKLEKYLSFETLLWKDNMSMFSFAYTFKYEITFRKGDEDAEL